MLGSKDVAQMFVEKLFFQEEEEDAEIHDSVQLENENYRSGTKADDGDGEKIVQSFSKCPGLSVRAVSLNKACRFAVVFAHEGISEL